MNVENINKNSTKFKILVAPLDWGLGHATRCIPIIQLLISRNITVLLAAEGDTAALLKKEFPTLTLLPLKGYRIAYSQHKTWFFAKMLLQFPKISAAIRYEKRWLKKIIQHYHIDAVIADNRFGLQNAAIHSVYITHQLFIETGSTFLNKIAQKIHYRFINRYDECWVPDAEGNINLAGKLSHPATKPLVPVKYTGCLSRFKKENIIPENDLLIMLSGPEPQRTIFENILLKQINNTDLSIVMVRGLPGKTVDLKAKKKDLKIFNHLPAEKLSTIIQQSQLVLARAGYSTIMDLVALGKKAVLVPTPGQTEQEYLAQYLMSQGLFFAARQKNFLLKNTMNKIAAFKFAPGREITSALEKNIVELLEKLTAKALQ